MPGTCAAAAICIPSWVASHLVLYERSQRQPVEQRIETLPGLEPLLVAQTLQALEAEAKQRVDVGRLRGGGGVERNGQCTALRRRSVGCMVQHPGPPCLPLPNQAGFSVLLGPLLPRPHLVVAADEVHAARVLNLERQQQADGLQRVRAAVHKVAQELPNK